MVAHLLNNHKEELGKIDTINCRVAAKHGKPLVLPVKQAKQKIKVECCMGCRTFYANHVRATNHFDKCTNKTKHKDICTSLLPNLENTVEDTTEATEKLKNEIVQLRKQLFKAQQEIKEYEKMDGAISIFQQVIYEMPTQEQEILAKRCKDIETEKQREIEDWDQVEWDRWFSEELLETLDD